MGGSRTYTQLLRCNRFFRRLGSGQVISELGNWFNFIAALELARSVSNAAPEVTTILLIARLIPFTFFAPLAGVIVDRWSRRIGSGPLNLIVNRLGALEFAPKSGISTDAAVTALYFGAAVGLFLGMMVARLAGSYLESNKRTVVFIGCV